jgi:hypothetical protein
MEKTPVYETGECRFDPCRRRSGASPASRGAGSTRRSSAGSERRSPKAEAARSSRAGEAWEVHLPLGGAELEPRWRHWRLGVRVARSPLQGREVREAIRLDEEPCSKHGTGASPWAFESPRFRGRTARWCGNRVGSAASPETGDGRSTRSPSAHAVIVQGSGRRALNPETGVRIPVAVLPVTVPGGRTARRPAVTRKVGVRAPPWQRSARWLSIKALNCNPRPRG